MVGILLSYWDGLFSGAMLVFREGKVCVYITLTVLTPLIETPDPPNDTSKRASKTDGNLTPRPTSQGFLG